jgi:L-arabinokinase
MQIVFYISGHGFGHASRDIELLNAIRAVCRDARVIVRTTAARWLFDAVSESIEYQSFDADTGMVQIDSLRLDEEATARCAAEFYRDFERLVAEEAAFLTESGADVVLGDIPPLAFAAAARTNIPSVAIGNFTWDWIYSIYPAFDRLAPDVIPTIRRAYASATRALRLPLHGGFESMRTIVDIPFIARRSNRNRADTRRRLGVPANSDKPLVLASFGGYGLELPFDAIARKNRLTVISIDRELPPGLQYQDVVAAADIVVSKPGYGIVSECIANGTPLLYTSRGRFIEYDLFVAEMPRMLRCRHISQEDVLAGRWRDAVDALLAQPDPPERPHIDGAAVAAREIVQGLQTR